MTVEVSKRTFNVEEYYQMVKAGILKEDDRVELINGEIVTMSPIGSRHAGCVKQLNALLSSQLQESAIISVQDPIQVFFLFLRSLQIKCLSKLFQQA